MSSTAFYFKSIGLSFTFSENMFIVIPVSEAFMNLSVLSLVVQSLNHGPVSICELVGCL